MVMQTTQLYAVHNQAPMLSLLYIGHNQALLMMWPQLYLHPPLITNQIQDQKNKGREVQQWDMLEDSKLKQDLFFAICW